MNFIKGILAKFEATKKEQESDEDDLNLGKSGRAKRLGKRNTDNKVVAVIITFCSGSTYDGLFTTTQQKSEEGTQVAVYSVPSDMIPQLFKAFKKNQSKDEILQQIIKDIKNVDADCVVFNWECSSGYSGQKFQEGTKTVMEFAKLMIDNGHMTMFSDFSLKALIKQWDQKVLGPNPFYKAKEFSGHFQLSFNNEKLKECPSAQLQIIGEMASEGHCNVEAISGTIVYTIKQQISHKNEFYELELLTVASSLKMEKDSCQIGEKSGAAGHVLLKYKSGGHLLTSMGHWVQLMKIDTSEKTLFEVAERQYGTVEAKRMRMEYDVLDEDNKMQYISRNAVQFVQKQAPCSNMAKKSRSKY